MVHLHLQMMRRSSCDARVPRLLAMLCALTLFGPVCKADAAETSSSDSTLPALVPEASTLPTSADAKPPTTAPGPTVNVAVTEWVIFVANPYGGDLNGPEIRSDALPSFMSDSRASPDQNEKGPPVLPIGVIRIASDGPLAADDKIDIQLTYKEGRTFATWPTAKNRTSGMLWRDTQLVASGALEPLPGNSWLAPLRSPHSPLLQVGDNRDSFLLYDVAIKYPPALTLTAAGGDSYGVVQSLDAPIHDLTFYKPISADGAGAAAPHWKTAILPLSTLTPGAQGKKKEPPAAAPAPANAPPSDGPEPHFISSSARSQAASKTPTTNPDKPTTAPATAPAPLRGTQITLADAPATSEADLLAPWRAKLAAAGVSEGDQNVVIKILAAYALDKRRVTAIYRMDNAELDKLLPIEIVPQPRTISRIALVVATGIDPAIEGEMDALIAQLASPSWATREKAMSELQKLGTAARSRLEKASQDSDVEVAYRAEQLLDAMPANP